jgi:hypothetical protein
MLRLWRTPYLFLKRGLPSFLPSILPSIAIDGKNNRYLWLFRACIHGILKSKATLLCGWTPRHTGTSPFGLRSSLRWTLRYVCGARRRLFEP